MADSNDYLQCAAALWRENRPLEAGCLIFDHVSALDRPRWAAQILKACVEESGLRHRAIEHMLYIAADRERWNEAHTAFSELRASTLKLEGALVQTEEQKIRHHLLLLAELVAKVVYNATEPSDEFDEDSGCWIAVCLKGLLDLSGSPTFSKRAWSLLCRQTVG